MASAVSARSAVEPVSASSTKAQSTARAAEGVQSTLAIRGVIGFNGDAPSGFILHPDDKHIIYPLGSTIVKKHLLNQTETFLQKDGHDKAVSCLTLSRDGKLLASGQASPMGFPAQIIVWDVESGTIVHKLKLHKGKVQDVAFSAGSRYLASLGGQDDNKVVVWDMQSGEAICGAPAANDVAHQVRFLNKDEESFVTGGAYNLRVWKIDRQTRKLVPSDVNLGTLKRHISCISIDANDQNLYCGTTTGDLLHINLNYRNLLASGPKKHHFSQGIRCVLPAGKDELIIGAGDGTVAIINIGEIKIVRKLSLDGSISSMALNAAGDHFFVATRQCQVFLVHLASLEYELRSCSHYGPVNDIAFAKNYSALFATAGKDGDIRVWHAAERRELLRIRVPNQECLCLAISQDGKAIISGWNDGKIRAFKPQSGKLLYTIADAHLGGVTAIQGTQDGSRIISGGADGQVRVWSVSNSQRKMLASMKEHKGAVSSIQLNADDSECVSASADGSSIVWSLSRYVRVNAMFAPTQFKAALLHPDQSQYLTTGTDRKITYWDAADGTPIRIMDGSASAEVTALSIAQDGERFVSGGADKLVKLWGYDDGRCYFVGIGHSGAVTKVKISPDQKYIVSAGEEGAVFVWDLPQIAAGEQQGEQ